MDIYKVQRKGTNRGPRGQAMPQYLTHKDNTFYFRQSVPQELRPIIGKREIKKSLGHDYIRAISECKRYAVVADSLIAEARVKLDAIPVEPYPTHGKASVARGT